jgi:hypothetical protein
MTWNGHDRRIWISLYFQVIIVICILANSYVFSDILLSYDETNELLDGVKEEILEVLT